MKTTVSAAIFSFFSFVTFVSASEYDKSTSPEVLSVEYKGEHTVSVPFEIGKSILSVQVDCQPTPEAATAAVQQKLQELESELKSTVLSLHLPAASPETLGYTINRISEPSESEPVAIQLDQDQKQYLWTNRCTGEKFDKPLKTDYVYEAKATIEIRFPNQGILLNSLGSLVSKLEKSSSTGGPLSAKVICQSPQGSNYQLDVTSTTKAKALKEVEAVARARAVEKQQKDAAIFQYTNVWTVPSQPKDFNPESSRFDSNRYTVQVLEENGRLIAKIKQPVPFEVFVKQPGDGNSQESQLGYTKSYEVEAQVQSEQGIYGILTIGLEQSCFKDKTDAENTLKRAADDIIPQLRAINGNQPASETDRLQIQDVASTSYSPLKPYPQLVMNGTTTTQYYYNACTLEQYLVAAAPNIPPSWSANQQLTIVSKNLEALKTLEDQIRKKYRQTSSQPQNLTVRFSRDSRATVETQDQLDTAFRGETAKKFLASDSPFMCEKDKFSFACLTGLQQRYRPQSAAAAAPGFGGGPSYSDTTAEVDATERGLKQFSGSYTLHAVVRKVLK